MRITVFGATGRTGRHVVELGNQRRHLITACTRRADAAAGVPYDRLVAGDGRDPAAVADAVADADAVIAIIAAPSRSGPHQAADVARVIVDAMCRDGVSRLIFTSPYPIVATTPRIPVALLRQVFKACYADAKQMERIVSESGLDWTVARLNRLLDTPARGGLVVSRDLLYVPKKMSRADAAATLLDLAETTTYSKSAVNVCGR
jgi:putative NADH-flavin reductase